MRYILILLFFSVGSFGQFNPTTWYNFGGREVKVNTYIGGIGGTINTKELLASKLGIPSYRIKKFKVTGVDIECAIVGNYDLGQQLRGTGCTYFNSSQVLNMNTTQEWAVSNDAKIVSVENMIYSKGATFYLNSGIRIYYCPRANNIGEYNSSNEFVGVGGTTASFINITAGFTLYCNPILATLNGGNAVEDINVIISRGGIVRYVTDFTPPNPITTLASGTSTTSTIPVTFTAPTGSTNAVDFYEVYLNGRYYQKLTSNTITGLTSGNSYKIKIMTRDIFYNGSLSNEITVSTL